MTTLLNQLEATGGRYGFQTMCEGGGMANATVIERSLAQLSRLALATNPNPPKTTAIQLLFEAVGE